MKSSPSVRRLRSVISLVFFTLLWLSPAILLAASGEEQGKLVHVADTRNLTGFNLFVADLYNSNRLLFTLFTVGLTAVLGLTLGLLMDAVVAAVGLDLGRRATRE
jgi:hypothetical protein